MTNNIAKEVLRLIKTYKTHNPEELCELLGIVLTSAELPENTRGFYMATSMGSAIVVNSSLNFKERNTCIAHELGHATLHEGLNYIFMHSHTQMVTGRYEREANRFAALLLMQSAEIYSTATVESLSRSFLLPCDAIEWAVKQINK